MLNRESGGRIFFSDSFMKRNVIYNPLAFSHNTILPANSEQVCATCHSPGGDKLPSSHTGSDFPRSSRPQVLRRLQSMCMFGPAPLNADKLDHPKIAADSGVVRFSSDDVHEGFFLAPCRRTRS